ncbi:hypothetical protein ACES2L_01025 [Bdellovibrio bacteriovorus]
MIIKAVIGFLTGDSSEEDHYTLKLEGRLNIEPGSDDFLSKFEPILAQNCTYKQITIDLTDVSFIYPAVIFFLLGIKTQLENKKIGFNVVVNDKSELAYYLQHCGLGNVFPEINEIEIDKSQQLNKRDVMEIKWLSTLADTQGTAIQIVDWFISKQMMSINVEANVIDSIEEILRNIKQHSGFSNYGYVGQAFPKSNRIRLAFYDNGVGIKKHLTKKPYKETHKRFQELISPTVFKGIKTLPSNFAIEKASIYEVSGTNYNDNSGAGIDFILRTLSPSTNGIVSIISGDGYVSWKKGEMCKSYALPFKLAGTLVAICIDVVPNSILKYKAENGPF